MRLIKLIVLAAIVSALASCSIFKNSNSNKQKKETEQVFKKDSTESDKSKTQTESKQEYTDSGTIVTERETKTVTEKKSNSKIGIKLKDLKHGDNYLRDSAGKEVKAVLDTINKVLTIESKTDTEVTTTTTKEKITDKKDVKDKKEEKKEEQINKQVATREEQKHKDKEAIGIKSTEPSGKGIIWGAVAILVIVFGIMLYFGIRPKKTK